MKKKVVKTVGSVCETHAAEFGIAGKLSRIGCHFLVAVRRPELWRRSVSGIYREFSR